MSFFKLPKFIRRYIRRSMHPLAEKTAWSMKTKLSVAYAVIAWHAFGFVCYQIYIGNKNWPVTHGIRKPEEDMARPAYQWAHALGVKNAKVIRVSKFNHISAAEDIIVTDLDQIPTEDCSQSGDSKCSEQLVE